MQVYEKKELIYSEIAPTNENPMLYSRPCKTFIIHFAQVTCSGHDSIVIHVSLAAVVQVTLTLPAALVTSTSIKQHLDARFKSKATLV